MIRYIQRRKIPAISLLIVPLALPAQNDSLPLHRITKNIAWFTPNEANRINGIAVGFQATNVNFDSLTINGLNADLGLGAFIGFFYVLNYELKSKKNKPVGFIETDTASTLINGVSLSFGGELGVSINGINLSGAITGASLLKGISVTGIFTRCNTFQGVCISGLHNIAKRGTGLQVGLFNNCDQLKGFQLGLWNKNGKRGLPFFNWRL